jgi:hypothetical protein
MPIYCFGFVITLESTHQLVKNKNISLPDQSYVRLTPFAAIFYMATVSFIDEENRNAKGKNTTTCRKSLNTCSHYVIVEYT